MVTVGMKFSVTRLYTSLAFIHYTILPLQNEPKLHNSWIFSHPHPITVLEKNIWGLELSLEIMEYNVSILKMENCVLPLHREGRVAAT